MKVFRSKSCVDVVAAAAGADEIDGAKAEEEAANESRRDATEIFIFKMNNGQEWTERAITKDNAIA